MSETTQIDPLAIPAGELEEPSFPILKEKVYRMEVRSFEELTSTGKDGKESKRLNIKLATTEPAMSTEDQPLHPGFPFNAVVFLTPGQGQSMSDVAKQAGMPVKAALGANTKTTARDCINNPSLIVGKIVEVKVGVRQGKGEYEGTFSNTVKAWIVPSK